MFVLLILAEQPRTECFTDNDCSSEKNCIDFVCRGKF